MLQAVIQAVREVAEHEILPRYLKVAYEHKSDGSLFTEADLAAQTGLVQRLGKIADVPVLGEEMKQAEQHALWNAGHGGMWCVDPIDGTSNFINGVPYFAVSVAYMLEGISQLGVVFNPVSGELFSAERCKGAYVNGERLPLRRASVPLKDALASVELKRIPRELAAHIAAAPPYQIQRNFGASTLDWCYCAAGRFDVYLHGGQMLWDYAAGSLIYTEAGGELCTLWQDDFNTDDIWRRSVIAALDPALFAVWKKWIRERTPPQNKSGILQNESAHV